MAQVCTKAANTQGEQMKSQEPFSEKRSSEPKDPEDNQEDHETDTYKQKAQCF